MNRITKGARKCVVTLPYVVVVFVVVCPVGTYYVNGSNNESAACVPCPLGFYKDQEGGQQCRPCGLDRNTTSLGARNASECLGKEFFYFVSRGFAFVLQSSAGTRLS